MVRKGATVETCENSKDLVKERNQGPREESTEPVCGEAEFRHDPGSVGAQVGTNTCGERRNFIRCEAVEEEVGHDKVIGCRRRLPCADVSDLDVNAAAVMSGAAHEFGEHGRAGVDSADTDRRIFGQQARGESAVAIAQDQRPAVMVEAVKKRASAPPEKRPEGQPLHPAIDASEAIEIGRRRRGWVNLDRR